MKEDFELKTKEKQETTQEKQQEYKLIFDSSIIPHENHTVFEINLDENTICRAEFEKIDYVFNVKWTKHSKLQKNGKIIKKSNCVYISALNENSAWKKFYNGVNGTKIDKTKKYLKL